MATVDALAQVDLFDGSWQDDDTILAYVDGTGGKLPTATSSEVRPAWGVVILIRRGCGSLELWGCAGNTVCTDSQASTFIGADKGTVGTAELSAQAWALAYILHYAAHGAKGIPVEI